MDRKIEHQPFGLKSLVNSFDWNITRLLCNGMLLFLTFLLIYLTFIYAVTLWRLEEQFHPEWHTHHWQIILDHVLPQGMANL